MDGIDELVERFEAKFVQSTYFTVKPGDDNRVGPIPKTVSFVNSEQYSQTGASLS